MTASQPTERSVLRKVRRFRQAEIGPPGHRFVFGREATAGGKADEMATLRASEIHVQSGKAVMSELMDIHEKRAKENAGLTHWVPREAPLCPHNRVIHWIAVRSLPVCATLSSFTHAAKSHAWAKVGPRFSLFAAPL